MLLLALVGCFVVSDDELARRVDRDGDGLRPAGLALPGEPVDCDDSDPNVGERLWFADDDGDGHGAGDAISACTQPQGTVADEEDCDDTRAERAPELDEICDGLDNDCDGLTDDNDSSLVEHLWFADTDGDGFGDSAATDVACTQPPGFVADGGDCNDADGLTSPAALELCDGIDNDCDALVDDDDAPADPTDWFSDVDGDGFGAGDAVATTCTPPVGASAASTDCDDADGSIFPGAPDPFYDGVDSDCAGDSDFDADGDGVDRTPEGLDCDDTDAAVLPGAPDAWYDGVDADCAGNSDYDADADGFDSDGYGGLDCDDEADNIHPGATDAWYDGIDSDCAGNSDFDRDADGDDGEAFGGGDCDDDDPSLHAGAVVRVPEDYSSITVALNLTCASMTIDVGPGSWAEGALQIDKPGMVLEGREGLAFTALDGERATTVLIIASTATGTVVRGFEVRDGSGPTGGIHVLAPDVRLEDLFVHQNEGFVHGGGISIRADGAVLRNVELQVNDSESSAGGMLVEGITTATDLLVLDNLSGGQAGGLWVQSGSLTLTGGYFEGNETTDAGAGLLAHAPVSLTDVVFRNNLSDLGDGGGAAIYSDGAVLERVAFYDNAAGNVDGMGDGGGLWLDGAGAVLLDVVAAGNFGRNGAGIGASSTGLVANNVLLAGNFGFGDGSGLYTATGGEQDWNHVTMIGNDASAQGGGFRNALAGPVTLRNSIVAHNEGSDAGISYNHTPKTRFENVLVWQNNPINADAADGQALPAFIEIDPAVVHFSAGEFWPDWDLRLQAGSGALGAGTDGEDLGAYWSGAELPDWH